MNFHSQAAKHTFRNICTIIRSPVPESKPHFSNLKGQRIEGGEHIAVRYDLNMMFALPRQKLNDLETRKPWIFLKKVDQYRGTTCYLFCRPDIRLRRRIDFAKTSVLLRIRIRCNHSMIFSIGRSSKNLGLQFWFYCHVTTLHYVKG